MSPSNGDAGWMMTSQAARTPRRDGRLSTADSLLPATPATIETPAENSASSPISLKTVYADTSCTTQRAARGSRSHSPSSISSSSTSAGSASSRSGRPSRLKIGATRCWIVAGSVCDASWTCTPTMVRRQEQLATSVTPEAVRSACAELVLSDATLQVQWRAADRVISPPTTRGHKASRGRGAPAAPRSLGSKGTSSFGRSAHRCRRSVAGPGSRAPEARC